MMARERCTKSWIVEGLMPQNFGNLNSFDNGQEEVEGESHSLQAADKGKGNVACFKGGGKGSLAENVSRSILYATCAKASDTMGEIAVW